MNVIVLLGTNKGDREANLSEAIEKIITHIGTIVKQSHIYETDAWGNEDQPGFLNMAIAVETDLLPENVMNTLLSIEKQMGRIRNKKWEQRVIDLDIIYYEDQVIRTDHLIIPHPEMQNRRFVLEPLNEILPDFIHPVLKENTNALLIRCIDQLKVTRLGFLPL
jgi:2-amino-4-hydroxy-6-hydroxymethyldihydropteridine diphosphokinase